MTSVNREDQPGAAGEEHVFSDVTESPADGGPQSQLVDEERVGPAVSDEISGGADVQDLGIASEEYDRLHERHLRLAAEFDNYRKRTDRERLETRDRAQGELVLNLLEALDDLERVVAISPEETSVEALLEGIQLVERKFFRTLENAGLEKIAAEGERFDPEEHEALMLSNTTDPAEDDTIGAVFQTGYRFRGALLRPARVQVRKLED